MLKDIESAYQKTEEILNDQNDVKLLSKDQELNFSNKHDDEDELDMKMQTDGKDVEEGSIEDIR